MKFLIVLTFLVLAPHASASSAKLIGAQAMSDKIFSRIYESATSEKNWTILDLYCFSKPPFSFTAQLGFYDKASFEIKNGDPNSYNMILYVRLVDNIAQWVAESCSPTTITNRPVIKSRLQTSLGKLCAWPLPHAIDQNNLIDFFHQITLFDYSFEEKLAWLAHFQSSEMQKKNAHDVIYEMTFTLMMNPYFLLKR